MATKGGFRRGGFCHGGDYLPSGTRARRTVLSGTVVAVDCSQQTA